MNISYTEFNKRSQESYPCMIIMDLASLPFAAIEHDCMFVHIMINSTLFRYNLANSYLAGTDYIGVENLNAF